MNAQKLKELVKSYFNLEEVKETFGELKDINGAFTLIFEGETLALGAKVKVKTTEGQELDAPDGYHELEGGITIKTEGGVVTAPVAPDPTKVDIVEPVNGKFADGEDVKDTLGFPELAQAIAEIIKSEMEFVKKEMADVKAKVEKMSAEPAVEKTLPKKNFSLESKDSNAVDPKRYAMMRDIMKSKPKNFNPTN